MQKQNDFGVFEETSIELIEMSSHKPE